MHRVYLHTLPRTSSEKLVAPTTMEHESIDVRMKCHLASWQNESIEHEIIENETIVAPTTMEKDTIELSVS